MSTAIIKIVKEVYLTIPSENISDSINKANLISKKMGYTFSEVVEQNSSDIEGINLTNVDLLDDCETKVKELPVTIIKNTLGHE